MQTARIVILLLGLVGLALLYLVPLFTQKKDAQDGTGVQVNDRRILRFANRLILAGWVGVVLWILINVFFPTVDPESIQGFLEGWFGIVLGGLGVLFSLVMMFRSQRSLGESFTLGIPYGKKLPLICEGCYAQSRNPYYTGMMFLVLAFALVIPRWFSLFLLFLVYVGFEILVRLEEAHLEREHGQAFLDYEQQVPRFFPWKGLMKLIRKNKGTEPAPVNTPKMPKDETNPPTETK